ncbi:MAG: AtpZ/AtpI family protein [Prolixibacteraceae bacterium]|jgi:hypothetical protein|nr:AtpZ/AtpI family protein [Prolixibacteraceae bacterium]MBT6763158.1 AtpZ/AtpI family protein [Prolixibacteraceae bacterium]MBT6998968.1 AtpZ/AtpI family protein [Prolixibacteraceae bacterium]MBT7393917.1 AtpZ/AtpI family protein [Prolixibacteraceae bacterium]
MKNLNRNKPKKPNDFIRYSNLGFEMMAIIGISTFGGYKMDQWMKNEFKAFTFGLMVFSVLLAIIYGTKTLIKKK